MVASLGKRILKWALLITPWLLALLLAGGWGLSAWTPGYLEKLVPKLADEMGLPLEDFHIRDAGLFSADIGPVRLGPDNGGLKLSNVHVTYSPASLKQRRVNVVVLDGVSLDSSYDGESFTLPILDLLPAKKTDAKTDKTLPELPFDSLVIENSTLHCTMQEKRFSIPFSARITPGETISFSADLTPRDQEISLSGMIGPTINDLAVNLVSTIQLGAVADLMPLSASGTLDLEMKAAINIAQPETLKAEIQATVADPALPGHNVAFEEGEGISLQAKVDGRTVDFSLEPIRLAAPYPATVAISQGHISPTRLAADFTVDAAGITLPGQFSADRKDESWEVALSTSNPDKLKIDTGGRAIRLAGIDFNVTGTAGRKKTEVIVNGSTKGASIDGTKTRCGPVRFNLPLAWPAPKRHKAGRLKVSNLRHDNYKLGTLTAKMRQESMGLALYGTLYSQLLPDLQVPFSGHASMESKDATVTFDIPRYVLPDNFDPSSLVPAMKDVKLSGNLSVEGGMTIRDGDIDSRLGVFLTGGSLAVGQEQGTKVSGIRLYFESPDLLDFRSSPAQMLAFDSISAGPVTLGKGVVTFQLEPGGVVLVERLGFDWVGGHVASRAFRIIPGHEEYDVTLFCSQLRLSTLLGQLGLAEAKGEAALSGELPVTWKRGKISFNDGFLHSTPGQGGTIQVEAMQDLVSAIPEGTPQRGQIELAQAAIKDFEYKWVRVKADTVGEELLVRLSLDGKPAGTLPFVYKKEFGGFAKVTGDVKGSNFQGLRLDVNFSLPLDRILLYKDIINMIE